LALLAACSLVQMYRMLHGIAGMLYNDHDLQSICASQECDLLSINMNNRYKDDHRESWEAIFESIELFKVAWSL
jgi:hypothetical protein